MLRGECVYAGQTTALQSWGEAAGLNCFWLEVLLQLLPHYHLCWPRHFTLSQLRSCVCVCCDFICEGFYGSAQRTQFPLMCMYSLWFTKAAAFIYDVSTETAADATVVRKQLLLIHETSPQLSYNNQHSNEVSKGWCGFQSYQRWRGNSSLL